MTAIAYHATTPGEDFAARDAKARKQDERVLDLFRDCADSMLTASMVFQHFDYLHKSSGHPRILLTSVRRAMSNLTRDGLLVHHKDIHRIGPHGASETFYQFKVQ